jgi:hypothetical protein
MAHEHEHGVEQAGRYIVVGLDFGTYASGFAYSTDGGKDVREFSEYPDQPAPYPKALSAILYRNGAPVHWGWTAQKVWMGVSAQDRCGVRCGAAGGGSGTKHAAAAGVHPCMRSADIRQRASH